MEFKIFNVRHGFCAALMDSNYLTLIDCGHDTADGFRPLQWLYDKGYRHINSLIISNFDQDHVSDIKAIRDNFTVGTLAVNPGISSESLRQIKIQGGPISDQMEILLKSLDNPELNSVYSVQNQTSKATFSFFWVYYPFETDTNNLSLVSFVKFGTSTIIYPGDLENSGWLKLLQNQEFVNHLGETNVFIASHHGRISGYCDEVFNYCSPEIVIISDKERTFSTQEHDKYSRHAKGIRFGNTLLTAKPRKVLTTRSDGHLTIYENIGTSYIKCGL